MSTVMQASSIPRLDFSDFPRTDEVPPLESHLSPLDFDLNLDPAELKDFDDLTGGLFSTNSSLDTGLLGLTPRASASPAPAPFPIFSAGSGPASVAAAASAAAAAASAAPAPVQVQADKRVAGGDATNRQLATRPPKRKSAVKSAPKKVANKKKGTGRKRTKMPEAEQKRRNCESAKRSRLKKMRELNEAREKAARLERENAAFRKKFDSIRDSVYALALHLATHHKDCECAVHSKALEQALLSPASLR